MSFQYLVGSEVDYTEGLEGSRFVVNNPMPAPPAAAGPLSPSRRRPCHGWPVRTRLVSNRSTQYPLCRGTSDRRRIARQPIEVRCASQANVIGLHPVRVYAQRRGGLQFAPGRLPLPGAAGGRCCGPHRHDIIARRRSRGSLERPGDGLGGQLRQGCLYIGQDRVGKARSCSSSQARLNVSLPELRGGQVK